MPLINLGEKPSEAGIAVPSQPEKSRIYYPSLHVDNVDLGIDAKDVGKEMMATIKIKVRSVEKRMSASSGKRESCSFDVIAIDLTPKSKRKHYGS